MSKGQGGDFGGAHWARNLDEVDREIARLATICNVRLLDPGIIERVLENDASVCGTKNPPAFEKLRNALKMHYHLRDKAVGAMGQAQTAKLVAEVVEKLKERFGDRLGGGPSTTK